MRVALVKPFNKFTASFTPPLGLGYLASMLKKKGSHDVFLYDATRKMHSKVDFFYNFLTTTRPQIVGIQVYTVDLPMVKEYLQCVKETDRSIITVIGGPHPSALPEETMDYFGSNLDFAIIGEGEESILSLVSHVEEGGSSWDKIPGLVWRDNEQIFKTEKKFLKDLDQLPWPDWDLLSPASYPNAPHGAFSKSFPIAPILTSRGCPMDCNFCSSKIISGKSLRYRKIDDIIAEVGYLKERLKIKEFMIQDDNFTFNKKRVLEFCDKIEDMHLDWSFPNGIRLDSLDDEVVRRMKEGGCYAAAVGIESGSQKILDDMNKRVKIETIIEKVNILAKHKIRTTGQFIIGYPTETRDDILKTIEFAKKLPIERAAFSAFIPLAGSNIYFKLKEQGKLDSIDLFNLSYYKTTANFTPHASKEELGSLLKKAMWSFYLRPLIILKIFQSSGLFFNLWNLLKRFTKNYV